MRTPADASDLPSRTSTHGSGSDVVRYSFIATDFHVLFSADLPGASDSAQMTLFALLEGPIGLLHCGASNGTQAAVANWRVE